MNEKKEHYSLEFLSVSGLQNSILNSVLVFRRQNNRIVHSMQVSKANVYQRYKDEIVFRLEKERGNFEIEKKRKRNGEI